MTLPEEQALDLSAPPPGDAALYQSLVATYYGYLRTIHELIRDDKPAGAIGIWLPYALFIRILQQGRAVHLLVQQGYGDEPLPIARAMISGAMTLLFIETSGNPDGWGLRYWLQLDEQERRLLDRELRLKRFDEERIRAVIAAARRNVQELVDATSREGIVIPSKLPDPSRKRPRADTWTGLSDKALAEHLNLLDWYDGEYAYLSSMTHAQAISVKPIADQLMSGHLPTIGPHYREPLAAIAVAVSAIKYGFLGFMSHFGLVGRDPAFQAANNAMSEAINSYREKSGANAMVAEAFGPRQTDG